MKIEGNDLRGKLVARRRLPPVQHESRKLPVHPEVRRLPIVQNDLRRLPPIQHEAIQVVVTNPKAAVQSNFRDLNVTEVMVFIIDMYYG